MGEIAFGLNVLFISSSQCRSPFSRHVICIMMPLCLNSQKANGEVHLFRKCLGNAHTNCFVANIWISAVSGFIWLFYLFGCVIFWFLFVFFTLLQGFIYTDLFKINQFLDKNLFFCHLKICQKLSFLIKDICFAFLRFLLTLFSYFRSLSLVSVYFLRRKQSSNFEALKFTSVSFNQVQQTVI